MLTWTYNQWTVIPNDVLCALQRVMQRIVQRYIFDIQREAEVTEGENIVHGVMYVIQTCCVNLALNSVQLYLFI